MAVQDIRSYEHRIEVREKRAAELLDAHDYLGLLVTAASLLEMQAGLREAEYQTEIAERTEQLYSEFKRARNA